ncbi:MAG: hypothetical protein QMD36_04515 [Candidatus Aenigmarchaeota archaeon]|nr:hypothetical protein [Candidatus Aenigmarchaeota archaeon]
MYRDEPPDISKEIAGAPVTKIVEEIDCFGPPRPRITLTYSGPNIRDIVKKTPTIIMRGMRVTGLMTFIDEYFCTVYDPNEIIFHIHWHGERPLDRRSKMYGWIRLKQGLIRPDGSGSVVIEFFAKVVTEWDRSTLLQRNPIYSLLLKIYTYVYYDEVRRRFVRQCREYGENMIKLMKEFLKIAETAKYTKV